jgi:hypothetical protein
MLSQNCLLSLLPALALAYAAIAVDPEVAEGLELYRGLKYDRAVVVLGRALAKSELPDSDRGEALETLGFAYTVLGDSVNAELTFHTLLDRDPEHALDAGLSPRLRDAFDSAKRSWTAGRHVRFKLASSLAKKDLSGVLDGGDPRRVGSVVARDEDSKKTSPLYCKQRACRGERPDVPFFIDVADHHGTILDTSGPHIPEVASDGPEWWVYAAIAAGVVGGGIAISVALANRGEAPAGSLGKLQLP